ncbi:MAG: cytochrome P460 family protein [Alphaproteobacteria bacterium]|nr:cytochrome P460 family protein [Alphaproteobacteria bacterium]
MRLLTLLGTAIATTLLVSSTSAGPELVAFPHGYQTHFVRYTTVDKPERKPPIVRFMYVNPEALAAAKAGGDSPQGTVLVMEDHKAQLDAEGKPVTDARGRFVPTTELTNVFVMEKQPGWGAEYSEEQRNGEWEYAWYQPNGERKVGDFVKFEGCFACHKDNVADQDYNFTFAPFVAEMKK